ncbi:hypothetical protein MKC66_18795 [[Clostridium] innocuum]|nr:hypothetical protein [[Clostridium] innocuum]
MRVWEISQQAKMAAADGHFTGTAIRSLCLLLKKNYEKDGKEWNGNE